MTGILIGLSTVGGAFTESRVPMQLKLPPGGGWSLLSSSEQPLTIDSVGGTKVVAPSRTAQWTALTGVSDYIALRPAGDTVPSVSYAGRR